MTSSYCFDNGVHYTHKDYPIEIIIEYIHDIFSGNRFYGAPHAVFEFNSDNTFHAIVGEEEKNIIGTWSTDKTSLMLESEMFGKEEYIITEFVAEYNSDFGKYYIDLLFSKPITWAEDSAGLTAEYKEKK